MIRCFGVGLHAGLMILTSLVFTPTSLAQDVPSDGYAIITSRDTTLGAKACYAPCLTDEDCPAQQLCMNLPDIAPFCLPHRNMQAPPEGWTTCEANVGCPQEQVCIRRRAPQNVDAFVDHKRRRGFEVFVVDETQWGGGEGDEAADNIRTWLQVNYDALNLRYVLLLGDPRPGGDVPMRGTRPAHNAHQDWADDTVVFTDYYFAELDGNWDLDGDGFLAEYAANINRIEPGSPASMHMDSLEDDLGPGGANREAEVSVGRIPFYGDVDDLDHILQKSMDYENAPADSIAWRRSALLAAEAEHRAFFGELIRSEILEPNGYASYRIYDVADCWDDALNEDVDCRSPIDGVPEELHCTPANVEEGINAIRPGFVTWLTHGSGRGAAAVMNMGNVMSLPDDQPFFTFQASCLNAQPAVTQNLAYELLKNGAIGTIGATTISHGPGSPMPSLRFSAGNAGMAYNFALRLLVEGMSAGDALADLRRDVDTANRWWYWKNYLTFNLYGDPALGIDSHALPEEMMPDADAGVPPDDGDMGVPESDMGMVHADAGGLDADVPMVDGGGLDADVPMVDGGGLDAEPPEAVDMGMADPDADSLDAGVSMADAGGRDAEPPEPDVSEGDGAVAEGDAGAAGSDTGIITPRDASPPNPSVDFMTADLGVAMDASITQNEVDAGNMSAGSQSSDSGCATTSTPGKNTPLWPLVFLGGVVCWTRIRRRIRHEQAPH